MDSERPFLLSEDVSSPAIPKTLLNNFFLHDSQQRKRKLAMMMIRMAKEGSVDRELVEMHDENLINEEFEESDHLGEKLHKRWQPLYSRGTTKSKAGCCAEVQQSEHELNLKYVRDLDNFENSFFEFLAVRKRAIANWHKLHYMLIILKLVGHEARDSSEFLEKDDMLERQKE